MTEPLLTYIKGQGWVYTNDPLITFKCGTVCRLYFEGSADVQCHFYVFVPL